MVQFTFVKGKHVRLSNFNDSFSPASEEIGWGLNNQTTKMKIATHYKTREKKMSSTLLLWKKKKKRYAKRAKLIIIKQEWQ